MPSKFAIPRYKAALPPRMPPAQMPIFTSKVSHPPPAFAKTAPGGPAQLLVSTAPRPHIPLTISPSNHPLWNPAEDSKKLVERDESGRIEKFETKFSFGAFDLAELESDAPAAPPASKKEAKAASQAAPAAGKAAKGKKK